MNPLEILKQVPYPSGYPELPFVVNYKYMAETSTSWNGAYIAGYKRTPEELIHEACHFWVASEKQRARPEFGLGPNAATNFHFIEYVQNARCVSNKEAWRQEEEASLLQVIIMRYKGMPIEKTLDQHGWLDLVEIEYRGREALREFARIAKPVLKRLIKKNLINQNLQPLV